jgi:hypothetical protein
MTLLPQGLIGLVLAGMFAHTMAMTSSDANAVSAVVVRDILPVLRKGRQRPTDRIQLLSGRICTLLFLSRSMCIALTADHFGGVMGLVILWYGALLMHRVDWSRVTAFHMDEYLGVSVDAPQRFGLWLRCAAFRSPQFTCSSPDQIPKPPQANMHTGWLHLPSISYVAASVRTVT